MEKKISVFFISIMFAILLIAIIPNTVSAATPVDTISVVIPAPQLEAIPATTATVNYVQPYSAWTDSVSITGWKEINPAKDETWVDITTDTFKAGKYYLPVFGEWRSREVGANTTLIVNGDNVGNYGNWQGFSPLDFIQATELDIQITEPVIGEHPNSAFTATAVPEEALREGVYLKWYEGDSGDVEDFNLTDPMEEANTFKEDKYYLAVFSASVLGDNYEFSNEAVIKLNGKDFDINDDIIYGPLLKDYVISFDPNGGTGEMNRIIVNKGTFALPKNEFIAPEGKQFKGWATTASGNIITESTINIIGDTVLYAIWEDIEQVPQTGDSMLIFLVLSILSLTSGYIIIKKSK